jgi:hypothetical protein
MHIINYNKLYAKTKSTDVMRCTSILIFVWTLLVIFIDHFVNFTLFQFKLLLAPSFIVFIVGTWVAVHLHEIAMNNINQRV